MAKGHENLIPLNKRPKEEQRRIQMMGGEANKQKIKENGPIFFSKIIVCRALFKTT